MKNDNFLLRCVTAVILTPVTIFFVYLGGLPFLFLCLFAFAVGAWEFATMYGRQSENKTSVTLLILMVSLVTLARYFGGAVQASRALTLCILISMLWGVFAYENANARSADGFAVLVTGMAYFGWLGSYVLELRKLENGFWWVLICLLLIWVSDTGAFFIGSAIGKHRMSPLVSPKKTYEGYFGGILSAMLFGCAAVRFVPPVTELMSMGQMLLLALLISALGSIGDFGESMIKRTFGVKDSSNLLPGHGGFFDRLDTILWVMPIGFLFYELINSGLLRF